MMLEKKMNNLSVKLLNLKEQFFIKRNQEKCHKLTDVSCGKDYISFKSKDNSKYIVLFSGSIDEKNQENAIALIKKGLKLKIEPETILESAKIVLRQNGIESRALVKKGRLFVKMQIIADD